MSKHEIEQWFESGKNYEEGALLYAKYGKSPKLKKLFGIKQTEKLHEKMIYELAKCIGRPKLQQQLVNRKKASGQSKAKKAPPPDPPHQPHIQMDNKSNDLPERMSIPDVEEVPYEQLPDVLKKERMERIRIYKKAWAIHFRLTNQYRQMSDEERSKLVAELVALMDDVSMYWQREDHFAATGRVLPSEAHEEELADMAVAKLVRRRSNIPSYISKKKKRLQQLKDPAIKARLKEEIARLELERDSIDKQLQGR